MRRCAATLCSFVVLASAGAVSAQTTQVRAEASIAGAASDDAPDGNRQLTLRFIPEIQTGRRYGDTWTLDASVSASATLAADYQFTRRLSSDHDLALHRAWLRIASPRFEARVGLQKISFGSASVFRPLMWFDRVDARDPTQFSEGVYGLLARYAFPGNHSLWGWVLYGNDDVRGWDTLATRKRTPEFGARSQFALSHGELGATYHHRRVDTTPFAGVAVPAGLDEHLSALAAAAAAGPNEPPPPSSAREDRVALDGKWDIGPGIWFEAAFTRTESDLVRPRWQHAFTVGADYTLKVGRGLTLLAEQFALEPAVPAQSPQAPVKLTALTASYPIGALDSVTGAFYYEWEREDVFRFVEWRRTWDHWRLHVIGFWNPDHQSVFASKAQTSALTGKGAEVVVVASY